MNTPSDLFNLYESYLGIYEGRIDNKKPYLKHFDPEDDDTYDEAMVVGRITGNLNQTLRNPQQTSEPAPQRKPSANNIRTNRSFSSLQFKPAPQRKPSANNIRKFQKNEVEYILDYLIDEGYTTSYESAAVILESMSVEWLEGIIEKFNPSDYEEYHRKNHQDEADDRSAERDKEYLDYLDSKKRHS